MMTLKSHCLLGCPSPHQRLGSGVRLLLMVLLMMLLGGCTSQTIKKVNSVEVVAATEELDNAQLLDVGVYVFDPGLPEDVVELNEEGVYPQVRRSEARYIPYQIRTTMERTNQWGAVRMLPKMDSANELHVNGVVLESDGFNLVISVHAEDATGRVWLDKTYDDVATQFAYRDDIDFEGDPFQDVYNQIANDLLSVRQQLSKADLTRIREVAEVRYAVELSPDLFSEYLTADNKGRPVVTRLPSRSDPMIQRVLSIKSSEYLFIDTVDQHYATFFNEMNPTYKQWRRYSYDEYLALQDTKRSARTRALAGVLGVIGGGLLSSKAGNRAAQQVGNAGVLGGLYALKQSYDTAQQGKIHEEALKELANSFDSEVAPIVVQVEGEVIKLSGSLDERYDQWRTILRRIYAEETGFDTARQSSEVAGDRQ